MKKLLLTCCLLIASCSDKQQKSAENLADINNESKGYVVQKNYRGGGYFLTIQPDDKAADVNVTVDYEVFCISFIGQRAYYSNGYLKGLSETRRP